MARLRHWLEDPRTTDTRLDGGLRIGWSHAYQEAQCTMCTNAVGARDTRGATEIGESEDTEAAWVGAWEEVVSWCNAGSGRGVSTRRKTTM